MEDMREEFEKWYEKEMLTLQSCFLGKKDPVKDFAFLIYESRQPEIDELEALNKEMLEALKFILIECNWEQGTNYGGCDMCSVSGDNRIGKIAKQIIQKVEGE